MSCAFRFSLFYCSFGWIKRLLLAEDCQELHNNGIVVLLFECNVSASKWHHLLFSLQKKSFWQQNKSTRTVEQVNNFEFLVSRVKIYAEVFVSKAEVSIRHNAITQLQISQCFGLFVPVSSQSTEESYTIFSQPLGPHHPLNFYFNFFEFIEFFRLQDFQSKFRVRLEV